VSNTCDKGKGREKPKNKRENSPKTKETCWECDGNYCYLWLITSRCKKSIKNSQNMNSLNTERKTTKKTERKVSAGTTP